VAAAGRCLQEKRSRVGVVIHLMKKPTGFLPKPLSFSLLSIRPGGSVCLMGLFRAGSCYVQPPPYHSPLHVAHFLPRLGFQDRSFSRRRHPSISNRSTPFSIFRSKDIPVSGLSMANVSGLNNNMSRKMSVQSPGARDDLNRARPQVGVKSLPRQARERLEGGEKGYAFEAPKHAKSATFFAPQCSD
jgi:hypothetical protein